MFRVITSRISEMHCRNLAQPLSKGGRESAINFCKNLILPINTYRVYGLKEFVYKSWNISSAAWNKNHGFFLAFRLHHDPSESNLFLKERTTKVVVLPPSFCSTWWGPARETLTGWSDGLWCLRIGDVRMKRSGRSWPCQTSQKCSTWSSTWLST